MSLSADTLTLILAVTDAPEGDENFLVTPSLGLMLWTLFAFGLTLLVLWKVAFPRIGAALDRRGQAIAASITAAEEAQGEAHALLAEYRERLGEARRQAEDIVARARKAGEVHEADSLQRAREQREALIQQARRDIEAETRRAIQEIRREVADLTVLATEKVTRKSLTAEDQRRLVDEALGELDFEQLAGDGRR